VPTDGAPSDGRGVDAGTCPGGAACTRTIFVTSKTYAVGVVGSAGFDSIDAASALCNDAAASGTSGDFKGKTFVAWLSDDTRSPADGVQGTAPYVQGKGVEVAPNWKQLAKGVLESPVSIDENGATVLDFVWTGTGPGGMAATGQNCGSWKLTAGAPATVGDTSMTGLAWTQSTTLACTVRAHLYCVEK
jgi:hypothetical protein